MDTTALWPAERSASGDYRRRERETPDDIEVALVMTASGLASGRTAWADQRHRGRDHESATEAGRREMMRPADDRRRALVKGEVFRCGQESCLRRLSNAARDGCGVVIRSGSQGVIDRPS